jgi:hypothetical protein
MITVLQARNERLTAALQDLVSQIRASGLRDADGHLLTKNDAFVKASHLLEEIGTEKGS